MNDNMLAYINIVGKKAYVPKDNFEYLIYLSDKYINSSRRYLARAHCRFWLVTKDVAFYFPENLCETNPLFYEKYIKTNIYILEKISFDDIFDGRSIKKGYENYYKQSYHIPKQLIPLYFDNEINKEKTIFV